MLENAWIIPLIPAASFFLILFFGKRMPRKGSELGIAAVGIAFVALVLWPGPGQLYDLLAAPLVANLPAGVFFVRVRAFTIMGGVSVVTKR